MHSTFVTASGRPRIRAILDVEISKKIAKGYPLTNTIFEDTRAAVLFQNGKERSSRS
jgi:hypothetical protein